jgi:hypothetical protein
LHIRSTVPTAGFLLTFMCATTWCGGWPRLRQTRFNQKFELARRWAFRQTSARHHLGVVEHQQITGAQQAGQVFEDAVHGRGAAAIEQARSAALRGGVLGDQGFGGR